MKKTRAQIIIDVWSKKVDGLVTIINAPKTFGRKEANEASIGYAHLMDLKRRIDKALEKF